MLMTVYAQPAHRVLASDRQVTFGETEYDRAASALWAALLTLLFLCFCLICVWVHFIPLTAVTPYGGSHSGSAADLEWTSRTDVVQTAVAAAPPVTVPEQEQNPVPESFRQETLSELLEVVSASALVSANTGPVNSESTRDGVQGDGLPGATNVGFDGAALQKSSVFRRQWVIQIAAPRSADEYARMLDHFGIEPAVVFSDGRICYLQNVSTSLQTRHSNDTAREDRFYTVWSGGSLQELDRQLFAAAGVSTTDGRLLQFYSVRTEQLLLRKAQAFAGHSPEEIHRTWFRSVRVPGGFDFEVERQTTRE